MGNSPLSEGWQTVRSDGVVHKKVKQMKRAILECLMVLEICLPQVSFGVDLYVPGSYTTIQSAINAANDGDTIEIQNLKLKNAK
ncbi:MAG: hypothetical protein AB1397_08120 [bacterium]